ncbi:hypothetical protein [Pontimicrobium sp. IMCC45349]|uniref:hypothetical protein n=1 Tax=Pontimicrobium sp. IMCC45349 TaxID=3391574 RepID=UPI00399FD63F
MYKNLLILILTTLITSCVQKEKNFNESDLLGKWTMYRGEVIIDGQVYENPPTAGELIGFEFYKDKTGLTTHVEGMFTWELKEDNRLISKRDSIKWNYTIKYKSNTEIEFIEDKNDRVFVWKMRKGWE